MAQQSEKAGSRDRDYASALTRLFIEALNARDFDATRALVSEDVEFRGPNGASLRGSPAASELVETAAHLDMVVVRTARTAVFRIRDGAIASYETLGDD